jgi:hypothetical protein
MNKYLIKYEHNGHQWKIELLKFGLLGLKGWSYVKSWNGAKVIISISYQFKLFSIVWSNFTLYNCTLQVHFVLTYFMDLLLWIPHRRELYVVHAPKEHKKSSFTIASQTITICHLLIVVEHIKVVNTTFFILFSDAFQIVLLPEAWNHTK